MEKMAQMAPNGARRIFVLTKPDLADFLDRTDLNFEIFYFLDFLDPKFLDFQVPRVPDFQKKHDTMSHGLQVAGN